MVAGPDDRPGTLVPEESVQRGVLKPMPFVKNNIKNITVNTIDKRAAHLIMR